MGSHGAQEQQPGRIRMRIRQRLVRDITTSNDAVPMLANNALTRMLQVSFATMTLPSSVASLRLMVSTKV